MKQHLPNILTIARLVLCLGMFAALAAIGHFLQLAALGQALPDYARWLPPFAVIAFFVAAITDFFDGWLARRWNVVSLAGAILDPIADKILVCGAILGLLAVRAPGVLVAGGVILFREFAVSALREVLAPRGVKLPVTFLAKTKTTLQLVALGAILVLWIWPGLGLGIPIGALHQSLIAAEGLFDFAALVTVWTGVEYALAARKALQAA
ncbi:MAG TPA: CDP-diacylglycerol--glycerol-3-phosphate 3-phosphatidyltransferase [Caulobacteraceae bacterium]|jgi:CDP-diacylglycerol--glycerol-3-phosphate 3-phosphatidyltransferase